MTIIKSATVYKAELPSIENMRQHLGALAVQFSEPLPSAPRSHGFIPDSQGEYVTELPGGEGFALHFRIDEKIIPSSAVDQAVAAACKTIEEQTGRKPGKKERRSIKDEVIQTLCMKALVRTTVARVFYHRPTGFLIVNSTSRKVTDLLTSALVQAVESMKTETINVSGIKHGLTARLKRFLGVVDGSDEFGEEDDQAFGDFHAGYSVKLVRKSDAGKEVLTVKMCSLQGVREGLAEAFRTGFDVVGIRLSDGVCTFTLTYDFKLSGIDIITQADGDTDTGSDPWAHDAAVDLIHVTNVMTAMVEMFAYQAPAAAQEADEPAAA